MPFLHGGLRMILQRIQWVDFQVADRFDAAVEELVRV